MTIPETGVIKMQHNIIVVGASEKVDTFIAKFRSHDSMQETSHPIDLLKTLGFREFYFKQGDVSFTLCHLSTTQQNNAFVHLKQIDNQLKQAHLCITCDTEITTIHFLSLVSQHNVGFIPNINDIDIINEIREKSSATNIGSLTVETKPISKDFIRKPNKLERSVDSLSASAANAATATSSAATLFARQAMSPPPKIPVVGDEITNFHL